MEMSCFTFLGLFFENVVQFLILKRLTLIIIVNILDRSTEITLMSEDNVRDQNMVDFMVDKWTNFAIHHNPTPVDKSWPAYGNNGISYVRLEDSKIIAQNDKLRDERLVFWKQIFSS